jgi:flagellar biosynthesis/type III secretory pathway protein FliH
MFDTFVPLALFLRPSVHDAPLESFAAAPPPPDSSTAASERECDETLRAVRRFRAALADALDVAVAALLPAIARDVLARELRLEPADVAAVVRNALDRFDGDRVLSIRANPRDLDALGSTGLTTLSDERLRAGDIFIELRSGTIDATLAARLDSVLAAGTA